MKNKEQLRALVDLANKEVYNIEQYYIGSGGPFATPWMPVACTRLIRAYEALKRESGIE